jgi:dihydrofolate reductase
MTALTYLIAASLDGFIAGPRGETDPFNPDPATLQALVKAFPETLPTPARNALGIDAANRRFDTVVMGRATYRVGADQGLASPYAHLQQYVVTTSMDAPATSGIEVVRREPEALVRQLKARGGLGIWLCGGGKLAGALANEIDEIIVKRHPTLLGKGIPMMDGAFDVRHFQLVERSTVGDLAIEHYRRR